MAADNTNLFPTTHNCQVNVFADQGDRIGLEQIIDLKQPEVAKNNTAIKQQKIRSGAIL